jgi:hypothetical protein
MSLTSRIENRNRDLLVEAAIVVDSIQEDTVDIPVEEAIWEEVEVLTEIPQVVKSTLETFPFKNGLG